MACANSLRAAKRKFSVSMLLLMAITGMVSSRIACWLMNGSRASISAVITPFYAEIFIRLGISALPIFYASLCMDASLYISEFVFTGCSAGIELNECSLPQIFSISPVRSIVFSMILMIVISSLLLNPCSLP